MYHIHWNMKISFPKIIKKYFAFAEEKIKENYKELKEILEENTYQTEQFLQKCQLFGQERSGILNHAVLRTCRGYSRQRFCQTALSLQHENKYKRGSESAVVSNDYDRFFSANIRCKVKPKGIQSGRNFKRTICTV